ncbi:MAG: 54S ribosomal protein, mitochondrial [Candelina mexicana]|nr:MAG: 54S ribosomal protein, mitochondrial [Candelina mexicana]
MATEASMRVADFGQSPENILSAQSNAHTSIKPLSDVITTVYEFPTMEPLRFERYPSNHLHLPLRRDILHRAVVYEGDATRQGTASTKWRADVYGSGRKIRRQKGLGAARLGDKKSPMLKGGGVAFGPHPRDFSTELPRKMYDLAWRTALSYRYRKGELIVVEDGMDLEFPKARFAKQVFEANHWGNADGRSLVVTSSFRKNVFRAVRDLGAEGRILMERDVDVKDLLKLGRIIIEKQALDGILRDHQSDLIKSAPSATYI